VRHEAAVGVPHLDAALPHRGQVRAASDQGDVDPASRHARAQEGPGGAGPDDYDLHGAIVMAIVLARSFVA